jgi:hypothetical protein
MITRFRSGASSMAISPEALCEPDGRTRLGPADVGALGDLRHGQGASPRRLSFISDDRKHGHRICVQVLRHIGRDDCCGSKKSTTPHSSNGRLTLLYVVAHHDPRKARSTAPGKGRGLALQLAISLCASLLSTANNFESTGQTNPASSLHPSATRLRIKRFGLTAHTTAHDSLPLLCKAGLGLELLRCGRSIRTSIPGTRSGSDTLAGSLALWLCQHHQ